MTVARNDRCPLLRFIIGGVQLKSTGIIGACLARLHDGQSSDSSM